MRTNGNHNKTFTLSNPNTKVDRTTEGMKRWQDTIQTTCREFIEENYINFIAIIIFHINETNHTNYGKSHERHLKLFLKVDQVCDMSVWGTNKNRNMNCQKDGTNSFQKNSTTVLPRRRLDKTLFSQGTIFCHNLQKAHNGLDVCRMAMLQEWTQEGTYPWLWLPPAIEMRLH